MRREAEHFDGSRAPPVQTATKAATNSPRKSDEASAKVSRYGDVGPS